MHARSVGFGVIEIDGHRFDHDVVVDRGAVAKRHKGPSKSLRGRYGHTPLSMSEAIPWACRRLIVGTGVHGMLPIEPAVADEARRRGVELVVVPTTDACTLLEDADPMTTNAILHATC